MNTRHLGRAVCGGSKRRWIGGVVAAGFLLLLFASTGCSSGGSVAESVHVSDSSGIRIVESLDSRWASESAWRVSPTPILSIGAEQGPSEYLFSNIEGVALLSDGRVAVADRGSLEVRFYDPNGDFVRAVGGAGDGPGEFRYIRGMELCGADSLYVFEIDYEISVLSPDGQLFRRGRPYDRDAPRYRPGGLECASTGRFLVLGRELREGPPPMGLYREEAPAWVLTPQRLLETSDQAIPLGARLAVEAEIGTFLVGERLGSATGTRPHPFGRSSVSAIGPDGLFIGESVHREIKRFTFEGDLTLIIRWAAGKSASVSDVRDQYTESRLASVDEPRRAGLAQELADLPVPDSVPAYTQLELDGAGQLWVRPFVYGEASAVEWLVFRTDGEWLGTVSLPAEFEVHQVTEDRVVGVHRDALGVERIRIHSIEK